MKKIVFVILILSGYNLFAQDCIPNPSNYSMVIINNLKYKIKDSLHNEIITWKDIEPLYDSILSQDKKDGQPNEKVPVRDSAEYEIEVKLVKDLYKNIDTLFARGNRIGIDWKKIIFKDDASKIAREKDLPSDLWFNDGKIEFNSGNSSYQIGYKAMLIKGIWKLVDIGTSLNVYDKEGNELGVMRSSYDDYSKPMEDSSKMIMDSIMAAQSKPANKKPAKPAPKKHVVSSTNNPAINKQDQ